MFYSPLGCDLLKSGTVCQSFWEYLFLIPQYLAQMSPASKCRRKDGKKGRRERGRASVLLEAWAAVPRGLTSWFELLLKTCASQL